MYFDNCKNKINEEMNIKTASGRQRCYGLQHILKPKFLDSIYKNEILETTSKPVVSM
jgi:hypothetical protein